MSVDLKKAAIYYATKLGYSIIPIKEKDKRPYIIWEKYQKVRADEAQINEWFRKWPNMNIGIVTGEISGIVVIDVDTDEGAKNIKPYIPDGLIPTADTPGGGRHYFFRHSMKMSNNASRIPGADFRGDGGYVVAAPSVAENGKVYRWVVTPTNTPLPDLPKEYIDRVNAVEFTNYKPTGTMFESGRRDNDLFHTANSLIKGGMQPHAVTGVLERLVATCYDIPDKQMASAKVESAVKRARSREGAFASLDDWIDSTTGSFTAAELYSTFQAVGFDSRSAIKDSLLRLESVGIIERHGKKDGCWRKTETECSDIDWRTASEEDIDIKWPFRMERYVRTFPKNIVILAGSPDSGKTAFLLNVVRKNMGRHKITYFSSEMGAIEMRNRISNFSCDVEEWDFVAKERASDFADVIKPDEINIIDFLEVHEDFWKVGGMIKAIFDKLTTGVAIIAIQKNASTADTVKLHGLGGERGSEKARLYLSLDNGVVRIVKGKNWRNPAINPNGLKMDFKIVKGCQFYETSNWGREDTHSKHVG